MQIDGFIVLSTEYDIFDLVAFLEFTLYTQSIVHQPHFHITGRNILVLCQNFVTDLFESQVVSIQFIRV